VECALTAVTLEKTRGGQADKDGAPDGEKPPALTAQTAASQQTSNFSSRPSPSQPDGRAGSVLIRALSIQIRTAPQGEQNRWPVNTETFASLSARGRSTPNRFCGTRHQSETDRSDDGREEASERHTQEVSADRRSATRPGAMWRRRHVCFGRGHPAGRE